MTLCTALKSPLFGFAVIKRALLPANLYEEPGPKVSLSCWSRRRWPEERNPLPLMHLAEFSRVRNSRCGYQQGSEFSSPSRPRRHEKVATSSPWNQPRRKYKRRPARQFV